MRYVEQSNGHPSWELLDMLSDMHRNIGSLQARAEVTLQEVRLNRQETREDVTRIHQRVDRDVARLHQRIDEEVGKQRLPRWLAWTGLRSLTEAVSLLAIIVMGLTGTLNADRLAELLR